MLNFNIMMTSLNADVTYGVDQNSARPKWKNAD